MQAEVCYRLLLPGDLKIPSFCEEIMKCAVAEYGQLDVLLNNAPKNWRDSLEDIPNEELDSIFNFNTIAIFCITRTVLNHLKQGAAIINATLANVYKGNKVLLLDYTSTKGAVATVR